MNVTFLDSVQLVGYPSGSTLSYFDGQIYLMGDDASEMVILDSSLAVAERIKFFPVNEGRILKAKKADIESSEWIDGKLWLFGSGSLSPQRDTGYCFDPLTKKVEQASLYDFYQRLHNSQIPELNIEAAALVKESIIFGSRGNLTHRENQLIHLPIKDFPASEISQITTLSLPRGSGLSGLSYVTSHDILLLTSSTEKTATAYDDGDIGESYLAVVFNISKKLTNDKLIPDKTFALSNVHNSFKTQKIESVCAIASDEKSITLVLVADDDKGGTKLFKLNLAL